MTADERDTAEPTGTADEAVVSFPKETSAAEAPAEVQPSEDQPSGGGVDALETPAEDAAAQATAVTDEPADPEAPAGTDTSVDLEVPLVDAAAQGTVVTDEPADPEAPAGTDAPVEPTDPEAPADEPADASAGRSEAGFAEEPAQHDPFAVSTDPLALIFQAPDLSAIPSAPAKRADREDENLDDHGSDETGNRDDRDDDDRDSEDRSSGSRRSRRRRGRGRSGGATADRGGDHGPRDGVSGNGDDDADQSDARSEDRNGVASDDQSGTGGDGDDPGSRRRRRRRRGDADMELEGGADDDPENTVTRVRAPRQSAPTGPQAVTGLKGSTRLEAKRQRRRDSRSGGRQRRHVITEAEFLARRESVDRRMLVRQREQRIQIAVMEDGVLAEHFVSNTTQDSMIGNVYLGKVQNVLPSMEAAFVDIGRGRNAVLYAGEVNWDAASLEGKARKIENALKSGDSVLVQVTKDPVGHKGARLTSQVSLPGRYLVYVPGGSMTGISRKLPDVERSRLKKILKDHLPENAGVIVRTAAEGTSEQELMNDINRLRAQWEGIEAKSASTKILAPELLYSEPDLTIKVVRDVFNEDFSGMVVQGPEVWDNIEAYVTYVAPHLLDRVSQWKPEDHDGADLFASNRIDEQLHKALERKVFLPSGGSLVIDRTEAMTVVDVNTGKFTGSGGNLEETVTKNNLEAAEEIVRQLRLRDIGGIIVIDFIDMVLEANRDLVLLRLVECLGRDRTKHQVAEVTSLGLVQMTRKRMGTGLVEIFSETCEQCNGRGIVLHDVPVEHRRAHTSHGEPRSGNGEGADDGGRKSSRSERRRRSRERQAEREREVREDAPGEQQLTAEQEAERKARADAARAAFANIAAATQHAHDPAGAAAGSDARPTTDADIRSGAATAADTGAESATSATTDPVSGDTEASGQEGSDRSRRRRSRRAGSDQGRPTQERSQSGNESDAEAAAPTLDIAGETVEVPRGNRAPRRADSQKDLSSLEDALDQRAPRSASAAQPAPVAQADSAGQPTPVTTAAPARRRRRAASSDGTSGQIHTVEVTEESDGGHRFSASAATMNTSGTGAAAGTGSAGPDPATGLAATGAAGSGAPGPGDAEGAATKSGAPVIIGVGVKAEDIARTE